MSERKDGRTTDTRQRILQEAATLYLAGGYENMSMQVLANHLGISKTAIFHHFKNKQELFYETLLFQIRRYHLLLEDTVGQGNLSTRECLRRMMLLSTNQYSLDFSRFQHQMQEYLAPDQWREVGEIWFSSLFMVIRNVLEKGIEHGELRPHAVSMATFVFYLICTTFPSLTGNLLLDITQKSRSESIEDVLDIIFHGLNAPMPPFEQT